MRKQITFPIEDTELFKLKLLSFANTFTRVAYLDSNNYDKLISSPVTYHTYDCIVGIDSIEDIAVTDSSFSALQKLHDDKKDWLFGHLSYDLKNEVEKLQSNNFDGIKFPDIHFFQPRYVFIIEGDNVKFEYLPDVTNENEAKQVITKINNTKIDYASSKEAIKINHRLSKEEYVDTVNKLKQHIQRGDIYEVNFCQEFYSEETTINPLNIYIDLKQVSPTPFSCYYKLDDKYLLSSSPERFLKKESDKLISQPIKGTIKRGKTKDEDDTLIHQLLSDPKEKAENVMIVDLVRNDLSRTAKKGTVTVEELFGIYSFKQVHQMISTVVSEMNPNYHFVDAIKNAFPMGSMTGAPKVSAMQIIENFEKTKRGIYSGAVGYISPNGNFDFNVIIRSILYNTTEKYLSFTVGSAITIKSIPEKEYEECLVKAEAMLKVLNN